MLWTEKNLPGSDGNPQNPESYQSLQSNKFIADKKSHKNMYLSRLRPVVLALLQKDVSKVFVFRLRNLI